jgi:hypothetical protein
VGRLPETRACAGRDGQRQAAPDNKQLRALLVLLVKDGSWLGAQAVQPSVFGTCIGAVRVLMLGILSAHRDWVPNSADSHLPAVQVWCRPTCLTSFEGFLTSSQVCAPNHAGGASCCCRRLAPVPVTSSFLQQVGTVAKPAAYCAVGTIMLIRLPINRTAILPAGTIPTWVSKTPWCTLRWNALARLAHAHTLLQRLE